MSDPGTQKNNIHSIIQVAISLCTSLKNRETRSGILKSMRENPLFDKSKPILMGGVVSQGPKFKSLLVSLQVVNPLILKIKFLRDIVFRLPREKWWLTLCS